MNRRIDMRLSAQLVTDAASLAWVETVNIGLRGCLLAPVQPGVRRGDSCTLVLLIAADSIQVVTVESRVTYVAGNVCGIRFESLDEEDFHVLQALLENALGGEADLHAEVNAGHVPRAVDWTLGVENTRIVLGAGPDRTG